MRHSWIFALSILSAGTPYLLATTLQPNWGEIRMKHSWNVVPQNWKHIGHPAAETVMDLYIALKPKNESSLIDALLEVSDPGHPKYGAYLSREQGAELVAPHPNTLELINSWLEHHGVPSSTVSTSHGSGWLTLTGVPVSQANALLGASYQHYQHAETKDRVLRTLNYALPEVLHSHVQTVAPTTYFGSPSTLQKTPLKRSGGATPRELVKVLSSRVSNVNPSYLRWRYGTQNYVPAATDDNVLAIVGFDGQYPSQDDLTTFMNAYRIDGADATFNLRRSGGGDLADRPSQASNLQIQYTEAITYPTRNIYYTTANEPDYFIWVNLMTDWPNIPQTISMSQSDDEQNLPRDFALALCDLFAVLGMRGASVITSSGDDAVGNMTGDCRANDGSNRAQFLPKFPASCPWVTSVGGTFSFYGGTYHERDEVAAPHSSGGFSNYFSRPRYQNDAVPSFLRNFPNRYDGRYNAEGRGFPDVSAQAESYEYVFMGHLDDLWGTGCSAPTMAAVISLLNDYLLADGQVPLGFLNPWLYGQGRAGFNDITYGANPGCNTLGFLAIPGWDPVTGFGSPRFQSLQRILGFDPAIPTRIDRRRAYCTSGRPHSSTSLPLIVKS